MNLRILMISDEKKLLYQDKKLLSEKGFEVFISDSSASMSWMINKVNPGAVLIGAKNMEENSTRLYHEFLDNLLFAHLPVIFALSEAEVYIINRKRTINKEKRSFICSNVTDAVSLIAEEDSVKRTIPLLPKFLPLFSRVS